MTVADGVKYCLGAPIFLFGLLLDMIGAFFCAVGGWIMDLVD